LGILESTMNFTQNALWTHLTVVKGHNAVASAEGTVEGVECALNSQPRIIAVD
jgi:hypothetical protein